MRDAADAAAGRDEQPLGRDDVQQLLDLLAQLGHGRGLGLDVGDAGDDLHTGGQLGEQFVFVPLAGVGALDVDAVDDAVELLNERDQRAQILHFD